MEFVTKLIHAFNPSSDAFIFMWSILIVAVFSLSIILERTFYLMGRSGFKAELFIKNILSSIQKDDVPAAVTLCSKAKKMALAQVVKAGLDQVNSGAERIR